MPLLVAVLVASVVGSVHCAGMCGGFVAFATGDTAGRRGALAVSLVSSVGRLIAYVTLGAFAGALGRAVDVAGALGGVQRAAAVVAGALIVGWGTVSLLRAIGVRVPAGARAPAVTRVLARGVRRVAMRPPAQRAFAIGLLSACLPCGWLYAFVVTAAGTASVATGALVMAVFWLGTIPMMLGVAAGIHALAAPLRRHVPAACAVLMIVVGLLAVGGRLRAPGDPHAAHGGHPGVMTHASGAHAR